MTNIAIVVLDSVRKDVFDEFFQWLPGIRFDNAWSTSQYTAPVHASMLTGKYPSEVGVYAKHESLNCDRRTLSEWLREDGYTTRAYSANIIFSPWNNFNRGFDEFKSSPRVQSAIKSNIFDWSSSMEKTKGSKYKRYLHAIYECFLSDCDTLSSLEIGWKMKTQSHNGAEEARDFIRHTNFYSDEFLFINLMEAHAPYSLPEEYKSVDPDPKQRTTILGGEGNYEDTFRLYKDTVRYLSDLYKDIFKLLMKDFDYVITLSDHGDMFGEYGARAHAFGVFPQLTHVPICISGDVENTKKCTETVSVLDIYQTVLDMADLDDRSRGQSLISNPSGGIYLTEYLGLRNDYINSLKSEGFQPSEIEKYDSPLYGIAAPQDYYGFQTLEAFKSQGESELSDPEVELSQQINSLEKYNHSKEDDKEVTDQIRRHLEELGYA